MNRYYLPIFEKMGYCILNPNQYVLCLIDKKTNEPIPCSLYGGAIYRDKKNDRLIEYIESYKTYKLYEGNDLIFQFGQENEMGNLYGVYGLIIPICCNSWIKLNVSMYPVNSEKDILSRIDVMIIRQKKGSKSFSIIQRFNRLELEWVNEKPFDVTTNKVLPVEVTIDNIYDGIRGFIDTNLYDSKDNNIVRNKNLQRCYELTEESLKLCIKDILDHRINELNNINNKKRSR